MIVDLKPMSSAHKDGRHILVKVRRTAHNNHRKSFWDIVWWSGLSVAWTLKGGNCYRDEDLVGWDDLPKEDNEQLEMEV